MWPHPSVCHCTRLHASILLTSLMMGWAHAQRKETCATNDSNQTQHNGRVGKRIHLGTINIRSRKLLLPSCFPQPIGGRNSVVCDTSSIKRGQTADAARAAHAGGRVARHVLEEITDMISAVKGTFIHQHSPCRAGLMGRAK